MTSKDIETMWWNIATKYWHMSKISKKSREGVKKMYDKHSNTTMMLVMTMMMTTETATSEKRIAKNKENIGFILL